MQAAAAIAETDVLAYELTRDVLAGLLHLDLTPMMARALAQLAW